VKNAYGYTVADYNRAKPERIAYVATLDERPTWQLALLGLAIGAAGAGLVVLGVGC
jgi:hypothetical protein